MKLLIMLMLFQGTVSLEIIGYNCEDAKTNTSTIDVSKVEKCLPVNETKIVKNKISINKRNYST